MEGEREREREMHRHQETDRQTDGGGEAQGSTPKFFGTKQTTMGLEFIPFGKQTE